MKFCLAFREHPQKVGQSYLGHLVFASGFGVRLLLAAGAAFVHALAPPLCEHTTSRMVNDLHSRMNHQLSGKNGRPR
ncbi:MAG: hypothetical protein CSB44_05070 [Gammaproteobacteria bacterium]|nr:MAG: hypothetical protein CSB44_05070 [Gammaproteobacteria bacterium]PIE35994.1 MAG: hypothetical protein CSA54_05030 [Gammaproteobacteria bacterium]